MVTNRQISGRTCVATIVLCMMVAPLASFAGYTEDQTARNESVGEVVGSIIESLSNRQNGNGGNGNGGNGNGTDREGDGNNGHGNDPDGNDSSNPGNGGGSPSDILGVETPSDETGTTTTTTTTGDRPEIITPEVSTDDPFGDVVATPGNDEPVEQPESLTTVPYGSVPLIRDDEESVSYLLEKMITDAQSVANEAGETPAGAPVLRKTYFAYAKKLAKTLGDLTQAQQNFIFYGIE